MIVLKFGGTSVASADALWAVAAVVGRSAGPRVVVVSALAGVTDGLLAAGELAERAGGARAQRALDAIGTRHLELADAVLRERPTVRDEVRRALEAILERIATRVRSVRKAAEAARARDDLLACGEELAVHLVVGVLRAAGHAACWVDARRVIRTDDRFGGARPLVDRIAEAARAEIVPKLDSEIVVVQGFVGSTEDGATTTLGRGGSDTTAALLGAALAAREVQIWTDVDGILSADPRVVPEARLVPEIGFEEAVELAYFGARVLHPAAAKHAAAAGVPLRVLNTFRPDAPGTWLRPDRRHESGVAAIAYRTGTALVTVRSLPMFMAHGFLARVFEVVARHRLAVDLVGTSHTSTAFTLGETALLDAVLADLKPFCETTVEHGYATFSVIGKGLLQEVGIVARVFAALDEIPVRLVTQASDVSLNFLVQEGEAPRCARLLHAALIEGRPPR